MRKQSQAASTVQDYDLPRGQSVQVVEDRQRLYGSFGNAFSLAVEFVAVPLLFAGLGYLFDRRAGTGNLATLVLFTFGVIGMFVRSWYSYVDAMNAEEAKANWSRDARSGKPESPPARTVETS